MKRNKNTVAKIVKEMRYKADRADFDCCGNVDASFVRIFADRIETEYERDVKRYERDVKRLETELLFVRAARNLFIERLDGAKKQISELGECLKDARRELCKMCRSKGFKCKKSEPCMTVLNIDIDLYKELDATKGAEDETK